MKILRVPVNRQEARARPRAHPKAAPNSICPQAFRIWPVSGCIFAAVVLLPLLAGVWLDSAWHTAPVFVLIGLFVGLVAGAAGTG